MHVSFGRYRRLLGTYLRPQGRRIVLLFVLLRVLLGVLPPDAGEVRWNGRSVQEAASFFVPPALGLHRPSAAAV